MTAEEFFEWCHREENEDKNHELIRGEVFEFPLAVMQHGVTCANVAWIVVNYTHHNRRGYACCGTGIIWERNPDTVLGPDLSYFAETVRYEELSSGYSERKPALVVEVLSADDRLTRFTQRIKQFLEWGVRLIWVIDPEYRTVQVFRPGEITYVLTDNAELTGHDVLPDFHCRIAEFFYTTGESDAGPTAP